MSKKTQKPSASDRTIDIFTKQTNVEAAAEADLDKVEHKPSENIEQAANRWRDNAFFTQETVSKTFAKPPEEKANVSTYRLTEKGAWMFLEEFRNGKDGWAYGWTGIMFRSDSLYELTNVFVRAAKAKKEHEVSSTNVTSPSKGQS